MAAGSVKSRSASPVDADVPQGAIDEIFIVGDSQARNRVIPADLPVFLRGWAIDAPSMLPVRDATIVLDGAVDIPLTYGLPREDIAAFFGEPRLVRCGFEALIPAGFGSGDHELVLRATGRDGRSFAAAATAVHIIPSLYPQAFSGSVSGAARGLIDRVATDGDVRTAAERAGRTELLQGAGVEVEGWGIDLPHAERFADVGALVDGRWFLKGVRGPLRPDVGHAYRNLGLADCGFLVRFVLNFVDPGDHELRIIGRDRSGTWLTVDEPQSFEAIEPAFPWIWALPALRQLTRMAITEVLTHVDPHELDQGGDTGTRHLSVPQGHAIFLRGWAIDAPAHAPASAVYLSLDGDRRTPVPARYGRPTPVPPSPFRPWPERNCGFTALIDTLDLEGGMHTLELLVVACNGLGYYPPAATVAFEVIPKADERELPNAEPGKPLP